jgi:hypothetical protein
MDYEEELLSVDPLKAWVTIPVGDNALTAILDDELSFVEVACRTNKDDLE